MDQLEVWSGIGVLAVAIAVLSPWWVPPVMAQIIGMTNRVSAGWWQFKWALPSRLQRMKSHWRGAEKERRFAGVLFAVALLGGAWLLWIDWSGQGPSPGSSRVFMWVYIIVWVGTTASGFGAAYFIIRAVDWTVRGWEEPRLPAVPKVNPMHRVGEAAPLGEARFANEREVSGALSGAPSREFVPPKFRD